MITNNHESITIIYTSLTAKFNFKFSSTTRNNETKTSRSNYHLINHFFWRTKLRDLQIFSNSPLLKKSLILVFFRSLRSPNIHFTNTCSYKIPLKFNLLLIARVWSYFFKLKILTKNHQWNLQIKFTEREHKLCRKCLHPIF